MVRLRPQKMADDSHAFPVRQLLVLGICRICEPIAFMSIFPYIYYMIESFQITTDSNRIAFFAGLVTSVFAGAECLGAGFWGRLSDKIGRKPVLLMGLAGTGISMVMFGFAPNLAIALLARALGGALNGNIGVLQTTVNEVVKREAHQPRAFAIMPSVWCLGAFVGSGLGGALADPVRNYPHLFRPGTLFDRFPYLLTNLVCAGVVVFSMLVGVLFLEETHEDRKHARDVGLEVGDWILRCRRIERTTHNGRGSGSGDADEDQMEDDNFEKAGETEMLIEDLPPDYRSTASSPELAPTNPEGLPPPAYRSIEGSPRASLAADVSETDLTLDVEAALLHRTELQANHHDQRRHACSHAFSRQVLLNIVGFGVLAYHTISAEQLLPVLLSMPKADEAAPPRRLPFHFTGGFALSTKAIGGILSVQGIIQMLATLIVFPIVNRRLGSLWTYRCVVLLYPLLYLLVPYITLLPDGLKLPAVYAVLVWKVTAQAFAFPSSSIMLANAAPSSRVLGTLNGAAASAASASRALGPTFSGLLQAAGLSFNMLGLPWWANAFVALMGAVLSIHMVEEKCRVFAEPEKTKAGKKTERHHRANARTPQGQNHEERYDDEDDTHIAPENPTHDSRLVDPRSPALPRFSLEVSQHS